MKKLHYDGPVVLVVMDGVGLSVRRSGNAVRQAHTEFLDRAMLNYLNIPLAASGEAVGIMPGQMGNSEVGHNALGSGQIIRQGIAQIEAAFATGDIWDSRAWRGAMKHLGLEHSSKTAMKHLGLECSSKTTEKHSDDNQSRKSEQKGTLHFSGIFSDGGVHSDLKHLEKMIARAYEEGVRRIRIHAVFDGRDVAPQSEPRYIDRLEKFCRQFPDLDCRIASGGGRMVMTADRYENDWGMVKLGWDAMVKGVAPHYFHSAREAVAAFRLQDPTLQDQYLPAFVVVDDPSAKSAKAISGKPSKSVSFPQKSCSATPVGQIKDGDAVIYIDFRADRAVEIAEAFSEKDFGKFDRGPLPDIFFAGLTEYNQDRHLPKNTLVPPITIDTPLNVYLGREKLSQLAVSETVKFGHITYYFNGNSYKKAPRETHLEIPSSTEPFNTRPWMKSAEITDLVLDNLEKYDFIRINYPGGDMVGHFAELGPTILAVEAIDIQLSRLAAAVDALGGMMLITADHGNAEELLDRHGVPKTAHTTNPVPCIFYDNTPNRKKYRSANLPDAGLSNVAATVATLLGVPDYPATWRKPLIA